MSVINMRWSHSCSLILNIETLDTLNSALAERICWVIYYGEVLATNIMAARSMTAESLPLSTQKRHHHYKEPQPSLLDQVIDHLNGADSLWPPTQEATA
jgi:hypothetical protein